MDEPGAVKLRWKQQQRLVSSRLSPIGFFEKLVDPRLMDALWELESLSNDRLREEVGDLGLVAPEDRLSRPGATIVMAAFTHIGRPSRFTDGSYGVYYAARELETAIRETAYHRNRFLSATRTPPCEIGMRAYAGEIRKPLLDIRGSSYTDLHRPDDYGPSQAFAGRYRAQGAWGLVYRSVRHLGGECIAAFRPPAVSLPIQGPALVYAWDGSRIRAVYERSDPLLTFD